MIVHHHLEMPLQPSEALSLCEQYLEQSRSTVMERSDTSLKASGLPPLMFSLDRRLYSKSNPIGLNPLAFIDSVKASAHATPTGSHLHLRLATVRPYIVPVLVLFVAGSLVLGQVNAPLFVWLVLTGFAAASFALSIYMLRVAFKRELLGFLAVRSNNSFKPKPLRGSA